MLLHGNSLELFNTLAKCSGDRIDVVLWYSISGEPRVLHDFLKAGTAGGIGDEHQA
jgi:hypothetical protein